MSYPFGVRMSYPNLQTKRAPRAFHCSECGTLIERGNTYVRAGHGRYCHSCTKELLKGK